MWKLASTREAYGKTLVELGREDPNVVVLGADLNKSTMTRLFAEKFPERFFDCGIAEQNMMGIAAGLASCGKKPFVSTFAVFGTGRAFDQIRISIAQPGLNVKIVCTHAGLITAEDGISAQAIEDLALTCSFPTFHVIIPADAVETAKAIKVASQTQGPFYIRLGRPSTPVVCPENYNFVLGEAATMRDGEDISIIANGIMVAAALDAAESLIHDDVSCRVINMSTLKPLDRAAILKAARETGAIVTAEEHLRHGGLGSQVAQVLAEHHPVPMAMVAIQDTYAESGSPDALLQKYRLTAADVEKAVRSVILRKKG